MRKNMIDFNLHLDGIDQDRTLEKWVDYGFEGAVINELPQGEMNFENNPKLKLRRIVSIRELTPTRASLQKSIEKSKIQVIGMKIHPRQLHGIPAQDSLRTIFQFVNERDFLLSFCTYPLIQSSGIFSLRPHESLYPLMQEFPDTKIVFVHGGMQDLLGLSEVVRRFSNAYIDTSLLIPRMSKTSLNFDLRWLFQTLDRKILFGTDYPDQNIESTLTEVSDMLSSLSIAKQNNILRENARLLGKF